MLGLKLPKVGLNLSGSTSKSTTNSSGTFTNTTSPVIPDWIANPVQAATGRAISFLDGDPTSRVAPMQALHGQAAGMAAGLTGGGPAYDAAKQLTQAAANTEWLAPFAQADTPFASGGKAYNWIGNYLNPYLQQVVDSSAADFDAQAGQVRAQQALDLAGSGAFGGSGSAITQSMTEGELARARASALSALRSRAFETALGAAAGDADRATQARIANAQTALQDRAQKAGFGFQGQQQQLQAAQQLANLTHDYEAGQRGNIETQAALANTLRSIEQERLQAPMTTAEQVVAMLNGLPLELFSGKIESGIENKTSKTRDMKLGAELKLS